MTAVAPSAQPVSPAARAAVVMVATTTWWALPLLVGARAAATIWLPVLSVLLMAVLGWVERRRLRELLALKARPLLIGVGAGAAMTAVTYPLYGVLRGWLPAFADAVALAYGPLAGAAGVAYLPRLLAVVAAEEMLWRVSWLQLSRLPRAWLWALSLLTYALAQSNVGPWVVPLTAGACGAAWMFLRWWSDSLWAPLLCHAIWSATVLSLAPVA